MGTQVKTDTHSRFRRYQMERVAVWVRLESYSKKAQEVFRRFSEAFIEIDNTQGGGNPTLAARKKALESVTMTRLSPASRFEIIDLLDIASSTIRNDYVNARDSFK